MLRLNINKMLSARKIMFAKFRWSPACICDERIAFTLNSRNRVTVRDYGQWVPEKFLIKENDIKKYKIDPRVRALSHKIIYSDYLERRSLRLGRRGNGKILSYLSRQFRAKQNEDLMEIPAMSMALKYLKKSEGPENEDARSERFLEAESEETESPELLAQNSSKFHMPYASTDHYENVAISEDKDDLDSQELNEDYVDLYEKYLETKNSEEGPYLEQMIDAETFCNNNAKHESIDSSVNIPPNWMDDYEQYDGTEADNYSQSFYGTPKPNVPVTRTPCGGCGALLQCQDTALPGYLPSELLENQSHEILLSSLCQRCHFMKHYKTALDVTVSPEEYPALLREIKGKRAAVILMVDLTDFPCSIWPGINDIISNKTLFIVGNKIDLLPKDSPHFLDNVKESLRKTLVSMGISDSKIRHIALISAKTGYGVESLINKLHKIWEYRGDVYLIGCTNVGKSSLFNALLQSDYCKVQAIDLIQRATISPWPGTTLNLLKFPILNPVTRRLWMRAQRLQAEQQMEQQEAAYRMERFKDTKKLHHASLHGNIGRSFSSRSQTASDGWFGADAVENSGRLGLKENSQIYRKSHWCYDTPGALLPDQVLHFLTTEELLMTLPRHIISPRSFAVYKGQTLFLAGLGRLDYLNGPGTIICTVFASSKLPVTMCKTMYADELYKNLLETEALMVPINDPKRLKLFPQFESKTFDFVGIGMKESAADVVLSSAGWIALTAHQKKKVEIEAWTPQGKGIHLRTPAMLSKSVSLRGYQINQSPAFSRGKQVYVKI